jgi:hypothetical protein
MLQLITLFKLKLLKLGDDDLEMRLWSKYATGLARIFEKDGARRAPPATLDDTPQCSHVEGCGPPSLLR